MATYYVRKDGNDTTGDGSTGAPWLSIQKAITTLSALGGDTLLIGDGTYQEDSGSGYLYITKNFTYAVTIRSESGNAAAVTIQGTSGTTYNVLYQNTLGGIVFEDVTFATRVKEITSGAFRVTRSLNLVFNRCVFSGLTDTSQRIGFYAAPSTGMTVSGVILNDCTFIMVGAQNAYAAACTPGAGTLDGVTFNNCTATAVQYGLYVQQGCANVNVNGGAYSNTGAGAGLIYGTDNETPTAAISGTITGATISSPTSHACLIGCRASGVVTVTGCTVNGGDYGIVVKENAGTVVTNNTISGGTYGGLYFKAATGTTATGNRITNRVGGVCIKAGVGGTGNKVQNLTVTQNRARATGTGAIFGWGTDTDDAGGCVVDYNAYGPQGTGKFGGVRADASVLSIVELRAAWADYGAGTNDAHSTVISGDDLITMWLVRRHR